MPTHHHKKDTTPTSPGSTQKPAIPSLPDQQTFRRYLRELARGAIRVVVEDVMREELDAHIGVGWGESSPKRKGYRNGFYRCDLVTSSGQLEDLCRRGATQIDLIVTDGHEGLLVTVKAVFTATTPSGDAITKVV